MYCIVWSRERTIFQMYGYTCTWYILTVQLVPTIAKEIRKKSDFTHCLSNTLNKSNWAPSSEFVSSSIPSWQTLTAHAQPFRGARDLVFCLKVPLDSLLVWASSGGSGETARMRRLAWTFAARIGDKYQIRLARPNWFIGLFYFYHLNSRAADGIIRLYN